MSPPGPKSTGTPRMGDDVASMCVRVDRLSVIEDKLSILIQSVTAIDRRLAAVEAKGSNARK